MLKSVQQLAESEIDELVAKAEKLVESAASASKSLGPSFVADLSMIASRGGQLVRRLYGSESQYHESLQKALATPHFTTMHSNYFKHVSELVGILKGIQHEVQTRLLLDIKRLLQADIFADFLEMAKHLLTQNYKDAAAVLIGAVLEDSLRKIADSQQLSTVAPNGCPLIIDPLNMALTKAGGYGPLAQKQITTWANLRNDAAHGHFNTYDAEQVKQMLLFVQKFCSDYLAWGQTQHRDSLLAKSSLRYAAWQMRFLHKICFSKLLHH